MSERPAAPGYVRVTWSNGLMCATFVIAALVAVPLTVRATRPITSEALRVVVATAGVVAVSALATLLIVRTARLGAYARAEGLQVRGILRSRMFPWTEIIGTTTRRRTNGRGGVFYVPALVVRRPERIDRLELVATASEQRPTNDVLIELIWLAAVTAGTAQRRAQQVHSVVERGSPLGR